MEFTVKFMIDDRIVRFVKKLLKRRMLLVIAGVSALVFAGGVYAVDLLNVDYYANGKKLTGELMQALVTAINANTTSSAANTAKLAPITTSSTNVGINNTNPTVALDVTGSEKVSGTLAVTGASTLASTLAVTGATTLASSLAVTGTSTLTGAVTAAGGLTAPYDVNVLVQTGTDTLNDVDYSADAVTVFNTSGLAITLTSVSGTAAMSGWAGYWFSRNRNNLLFLHHLQ